MGAERNLRIKICGMRDANNIRQVATFNPDYLGFIFYPSSPRFVGDDFSVPSDLPASVQKVGVFVNETTEKILEQASAHKLDYIQLHGNEPLQQSIALKDAGLKVIKVFSVGDTFNFNVTKQYVPVVDFFLFDTKGKLYGGNAKTFNWEILKHYDQELPFFLSGGLSPENIVEVSTLKDMNLHALDVNSGVEDLPGLKSTEKIRTLLTNLNSKLNAS